MDPLSDLDFLEVFSFPRELGPPSRRFYPAPPLATSQSESSFPDEQSIPFSSFEQGGNRVRSSEASRGRHPLSPSESPPSIFPVTKHFSVNGPDYVLSFLSPNALSTTCAASAPVSWSRSFICPTRKSESPSPHFFPSFPLLAAWPASPRIFDYCLTLSPP